MARPITIRTAKTLPRDVEHINRMRAGVLVDRTIPEEHRTKIILAIDRLINAVLPVIRKT